MLMKNTANNLGLTLLFHGPPGAGKTFAARKAEVQMTNYIPQGCNSKEDHRSIERSLELSTLRDRTK